MIEIKSHKDISHLNNLYHKACGTLYLDSFLDNCVNWFSNWNTAVFYCRKDLLRKIMSLNYERSSYYLKREIVIKDRLFLVKSPLLKIIFCSNENVGEGILVGCEVSKSFVSLDSLEDVFKSLHVYFLDEVYNFDIGRAVL